MKKVAIFDIDGTLVDTNWIHVKLWHKAFKKYGIEVEPLDVLAQIGRGSEDIVKVFLEKNEIDERGRKIIAFYRKAYANLNSEVKGFPRVRELFLELKKRGKKVFLASSAKEKTVKRHIKILKVSDLIDGFVSTSEGVRSKPYPDIFRRVLERAGVKSYEAVVVGDSVWDIKAAESAGIDSIGVLSGGIPENLLREAGAKEVFKDVGELCAKLDTSLLK